MMNRPLRTFLMLAALIGVLVLGLLSGRRAVKGSNDFDTFYNAGRAVLAKEGIYYTGEYYRSDNARGPFLYPPFAAIVFAPLALLPLRLSAMIWTLLSAVFFAVSVRLCMKILFENVANNRGDCFRPSRGLWLTAGFLIALLVDNLTMAQVNIFVLCLALGGLYFLTRKYFFWGGMILAAAVAIKITPVFFVLYFLAKKQWKALAGFFVGVMVCFLLAPSFVLGFRQNIIAHRQWLGRSLKPALIDLYVRIYPEKPHPFKKTLEAWRIADLYSLLTPKNQSFSAAVTRWCLKDRNVLAAEVPIYVAQRYTRLPVLGGGMPNEILKPVLASIEMAALIFLFVLFVRARRGSEQLRPTAEWGLIFLIMTLFSPLARSHQFVFWMLPALWMQCVAPEKLRRILYAAIVLYFLQVLPYGKAAGMGAWANVMLLAGPLIFLAKSELGGASGKKDACAL